MHNLSRTKENEEIGMRITIPILEELLEMIILKLNVILNGSVKIKLSFENIFRIN